VNASTITEPEFARRLAVAEAGARGSYTPTELRSRDIRRLQNIIGFVTDDMNDESVVYDGFDRAQTRHHARVVRDLATAEIARRNS